MSEVERFQIKKDLIRKRLLKYTRKAFRMLPWQDKPRILDVGCGSGVPTIELARLSNGEVTGLDIDEALLNILRGKIEKEGVSDRVKTMKCSILDMEFPDESFDIIWSEGSVFTIGFEKGLRQWKRFLKPGGFIVVHDEQGAIEEKLQKISSCGYQLLGYFLLDEDVWWTEYFAPLQKLIEQTQAKCADDSQVIEGLRRGQWEIDTFKQNPALNSSAFFIMRKMQ